MESILKIKKSQVGFMAFIFVIVVLLGFSLFFIVLNYTWGEIKTPLSEGLDSAMPDTTDVNTTKVLEQTTDMGLLFDKLIPFLLIGLFAFVLITAGIYSDSPMMLIIGVIVLGVVFLLAVIYSNVYHGITSSGEFATTAADMPIQDKFMNYLPIIVFIMAIGVVIAVIISRKGGSQGL